MNIIDTRDLNERLETLEQLNESIKELNETIGDYEEELDDIEENEELDDIIETINDLQDELDYTLRDFDSDEYEELCSMRNEIPEWEDGNTLVSDDDWVDYVMEMLSDCGDLPRDIPWYIAIDEEQTARNIQQDYSCITFEGTDYWYRN